MIRRSASVGRALAAIIAALSLYLAQLAVVGGPLPSVPGPAGLGAVQVKAVVVRDVAGRPSVSTERTPRLSKKNKSLPDIVLVAAVQPEMRDRIARFASAPAAIGTIGRPFVHFRARGPPASSRSIIIPTI